MDTFLSILILIKIKEVQKIFIINNKINDVGIIKWKNNSSYMGEIKNGVKDGIGVFNWPDGSKVGTNLFFRWKYL